MRCGVLLAVLALAVAGCSTDPPTNEEATTALGEEVEVEVTATTGAIRGVVIDEAIRPVMNAVVKLQSGNDPLSVNTTDSGTFTFNNLEPGTYFVEASKSGFFSAQQTVEVVAGEEEPPVVRILLSSNPDDIAYVSAQTATGFIVCTTSIVAVCGAPDIVLDLIVCDFFQVCVGPVTGDRFGFYLYYEPNATMIQAEMVWDSTQPLTTELSLSMETIEGCEDGGYGPEYAAGDSPVYNIANETDIDDSGLGGTCGIWYSVFSGEAVGPAGVTVQQQFDIFSHEFHGYTPPDGWRLSVDGDPPAPPQ